MTKTIFVFGLISGVILCALMAINMAYQDLIGFDKGEIIGYTTMLAAFLLIYFGVRSYRDNVAGGSIGFGRAFSVGILIGAVASVCYVVTWEIVYYNSNFGPDFIAKYQAHAIEKERASGKSQAEIDKTAAELRKWSEYYKNPAVNAAMTFLEPLPVALVIALVSAGLLRRRRNGSTSDARARTSTVVA